MASIRAAARKVVCIGRNYAAHIQELQNAQPKQPFFFLKPPSSILAPREGPLLIPKGVIAHYEVELGCIMGEQLSDLEPGNEQRAMDAVQGYCLAIDMTARNVQDEAKRKGLPWSIAKGFDTFLPLSNFVGKQNIRDPHRLQLSLAVNGKTRQNDSTALMLFRIPRILSEISQVMTLQKGDLVLTGTPSGVGPVEPGDVMQAQLQQDEKVEAEIEVQVSQSTGLYRYRET